LGNPSLFQIPTRIVLNELGRRLGRPATLDDIPDQDLDRLAAQGFDWIWYLGVWQTGPAGRKLSQTLPEWQADFRNVLPDLKPEDICGSPFAIVAYTVHVDFGGDAALARLRERIRQRGMRLMLDFVPNHTALDHPWAQAHPEFYVAGVEEQLRSQPQNYIRIETAQGAKILAHGRDPYFSGWPDTLQLNYQQSALHAEMGRELLSVASRCDGVRCDMAMLLLPEVFERTWGLHPEPFWPDAIRAVHAQFPEFVLMAEVYWDMEWTLQQQGFEFTYDKRLYDRLRDRHAVPIRQHFGATFEYQRSSARFLENHDERPAAAVFPWEIHQAAAILTYLCLGLRFFHQGQLEGWAKGYSVHLGRIPEEPVHPEVLDFYQRLLPCVHRPEVRNGNWHLLDCSPNGAGSWESFVCFLWEIPGETSLLVAVNYAPDPGQAWVQVPLQPQSAQTLRGHDLLTGTVHELPCDQSKGIALDLPPWGYRVLQLGEKPR
jgi:hypothetical protein